MNYEHARQGNGGLVRNSGQSCGISAGLRLISPDDHLGRIEKQNGRFKDQSQDIRTNLYKVLHNQLTPHVRQSKYGRKEVHACPSSIIHHIPTGPFPPSSHNYQTSCSLIPDIVTYSRAMAARPATAATPTFWTFWAAPATGGGVVTMGGVGTGSVALLP